MKIYKYQLDSGSNKLDVPIGSKLLSIKVQHGVPIGYFAVDENATGEEMVFIDLVVTGGTVPEGEFINTLINRGAFVLHAFLLK